MATVISIYMAAALLSHFSLVRASSELGQEG
jgi:hypothetical protein